MFWKTEKSVKFIVTFELGRLGRWLRLLGYDTAYFDRPQKRELLITSLRENRVILTREKKLSRFSGTRMVHIKNDFVEDQILQVIKAMKLKIDENKIFTRCTICNTPIQDIDKKEIKELIPPYVYKTQDYFKRCPNCNKIYWKGTHWNLATDFLKQRANV